MLVSWCNNLGCHFHSRLAQSVHLKSILTTSRCGLMQRSRFKFQVYASYLDHILTKKTIIIGNVTNGIGGNLTIRGTLKTFMNQRYWQINNLLLTIIPDRRSQNSRLTWRLQTYTSGSKTTTTQAVLTHSAYWLTSLKFPQGIYDACSISLIRILPKLHTWWMNCSYKTSECTGAMIHRCLLKKMSSRIILGYKSLQWWKTLQEKIIFYLCQ